MNHIDKNYFISCPHCQTTIEISFDQLNCQIFRCGVYKTIGTPPINPHTTEEVCKRLVKDNLIWGCGGPFKFNGHTITLCGYI